MCLHMHGWVVEGQLPAEEFNFEVKLYPLGHLSHGSCYNEANKDVLSSIYILTGINAMFKCQFGATDGKGAFRLGRTQFYMLSGPPLPLFACNTQWKCIEDLTPPTPPRCVSTKWKAPNVNNIFA